MLLLYRIYQIFIFCPIIVVSTIIIALMTVIGSALGYGRWWGYYPEVIWARIFCRLAFVSVEVKGRDNIDPHTSYVFVANHQGAYDIFSLFGYLGHNFRWMMKESLRKIPFVGWACKAAGQIFVDNSSVSATRRTMQEAEKQLRGGMSLTVFPEGARSWDGNMRRFKREPTNWPWSLISPWCRSPSTVLSTYCRDSSFSPAPDISGLPSTSQSTPAATDTTSPHSWSRAAKL